MKKYYVSMQGTPETVEQAIKALDKCFRHLYNVHGVHRDHSQYDAVVDVLTVDVSLDADWSDIKGYTIKALASLWYAKLAKNAMFNDLIVGTFTE